jgi:hypothetical protein
MKMDEFKPPLSCDTYHFAGKKPTAVLLSDSPDGLRNPVKIDDGLCAAGGCGSATLTYILRDRILTPAGLQDSDVSVALR